MYVALGHVWLVNAWPVTGKRALDLSGVALLLPIALPLIAGCALLVWLRDGAFPFHAQWRVGRGGRRIACEAPSVRPIPGVALRPRAGCADVTRPTPLP